MRASPVRVALLLFCCSLPLSVGGSLTAASDACMATPPVATVTFSAACTDINITTKSCWTPSVPTAADTVLFPSGTKASVMFAGYIYYPLIAANIIIDDGAVVQMFGGGFSVASCLYVRGNLSLVSTSVDNGTTPVTNFPADASVPFGTDCAVVKQGFTPRLCGPGKVYVTGYFGLTGLYASVFAQTEIAVGAATVVGSRSFVWGNMTARGSLESTGDLYVHGYLSNYGTALVDRLRFDIWATTYAVRSPVTVENYGTLVFNHHDTDEYFNMVDTVSTTYATYADKTNGPYAMTLVNHGGGSILFNISTVQYSKMFFGAVSNIVNDAGATVTWNCSNLQWPAEKFYHSGTVVNAGTLVGAGMIYIHLSNYHSKNGTTTTSSGAYFYLDQGWGHFVNRGRVVMHRSMLRSTLPISIDNYGSLEIETSREASPDQSAISADDAGQQRCTIVNNAASNVTFQCRQNGCEALSAQYFDMFNWGTIRWVAAEGTTCDMFRNRGSMINAGLLRLDGCITVFLTDLISKSGALQTSEDASFNMGNVAGADSKTATICRRRGFKKPPPEVHVPHVDVTLSNVSCLPGGVCPFPMCCGKGGFCETARCQMSNGYDGGAFCCADNAVCSGSSHGPYCGAGGFLWELDVECMEGLDFVDRYSYRQIMKLFRYKGNAFAPPKFNKHRYSFRGASTIAGNVVTTEPIEVREQLSVRGPQGRLRVLMDNGEEPLRGDRTGEVVVEAGGKLFTGIKTTFTDATRITVRGGGAMIVPKYSKLLLFEYAPLTVDRTGELVLDGYALVHRTLPAKFEVGTHNEDEAPTVRCCGDVSGVGGALAEGGAQYVFRC